jgi:hypothetical protein
VLQEEERVGTSEDGVLISTSEAALRRAQVTEEEWELRERRHHVVADALTKSVPTPALECNHSVLDDGTLYILRSYPPSHFRRIGG